jgi:CheY-like chemotaxis protein
MNNMMSMKFEHIFLVDDHYPMNVLNGIIIEEEDFASSIASALSGKEALEYLNDGANPIPDIIFFDLNMPGMNGWELYEEYAKLPKLKNTLSFILTASIALSDKIKAENIVGISGLFEKPLSKEIINQVKQICTDKVIQQ